MSGAGMQSRNTDDDDVIEEAFRMVDIDGNGYVSMAELGKVMRIVGCNPTEKDIEAFAKQLDTDGSGKIEFNEFKTFMLDYKAKHPNEQAALEQAFKMFDTNGDGYITAAEIKRLLKSLNQDLPDDQVDEMIAVADKDNDGRINYKEFSSFLCSSM